VSGRRLTLRPLRLAIKIQYTLLYEAGYQDYIYMEVELYSLLQYYNISALLSIFHPLSNVLINLPCSPFDVTEA